MMRFVTSQRYLPGSSDLDRSTPSVLNSAGRNVSSDLPVDSKSGEAGDGPRL